jgi:hypothetical protein
MISAQTWTLHFMDFFPARSERFFLGLESTKGNQPTLDLGGTGWIDGTEVPISYRISADFKELKIAQPSIVKTKNPVAASAGKYRVTLPRCARSSRVSRVSRPNWFDERVNHPAHMIGGHKVVQHHRKQRALISSLTLDVTHKKRCLRLARQSSHLSL